MDFADIESKTGLRMPFNIFPNNKNLSLKMHIPLGMFYSPFTAQAAQYNSSAVRCQKCSSVVSPFSTKNKVAKKWVCGFCNSENPLLVDVGNYVSQQFLHTKEGETGLFFIIDLAMPETELAGLKDVLLKTVERLPKNIFVGLVTFHRTVNLCDFGESYIKFVSFNGAKQYSVLAIQQQLGFNTKNDPRAISTTAISRFFVPLQQNLDKLTQVIQSLECDTFPFDKNDRQLRATGSALNLALSVIQSTGINARISLMISGPCTLGPGQVVNVPLKQTLRTFMDINQNNDNVRYMKAAKKYYDEIEKRLINKHTLDIWAYGLDQYGLLQMKDMAIKSGGLIAMHELFTHFIFENSFMLHYEANQNGCFKFPVCARLYMYISKQMKINGIIGYCKSLKEDKLAMSSEMVIGEGSTNHWYLGGLQYNSALAVYFSNADGAKQDAKHCVVQFVTVFKYSDNITRIRVTNTMKDYFKESQIKQVTKSFDQQAAIVLLARFATYKGQVEEVAEVKKWLDRVLLKFIVRFGSYHRFNIQSFRLSVNIKSIPQYIYHLRRSTLINTFGCSPDQSTFTKSCLWRECIANCLVMIQPALIMYTIDNPSPKAVELDLYNMKQDVVLLLDSYFNVLIWYGEHIYNWKIQKMNENEEYSYLNDLFNNPLEDSSLIMYDRVPVPNFYETFKGDGKQRYLKSRVNPSTSQTATQIQTGNFVSDDAPIKVFMDYLIKSVVHYAD